MAKMRVDMIEEDELVEWFKARRWDERKTQREVIIANRIGFNLYGLTEGMYLALVRGVGDYWNGHTEFRIGRYLVDSDSFEVLPRATVDGGGWRLDAADVLKMRAAYLKAKEA